MFAFGARRVLEELGRFRPDILEAARAAIATTTDDLGFLRLGKEAFLACPAESIDRAVMERTAHAAVIPADFAWSDVGSWSALWDIAEKDADGNVTRGDAHLHDVTGSYVRADSRLVYLLGVKDLLVVETDGELVGFAVPRLRAIEPAHWEPALCSPSETTISGSERTPSVLHWWAGWRCRRSVSWPAGGFIRTTTSSSSRHLPCWQRPTMPSCGATAGSTTPPRRPAAV